ncbi:hypothetical protein BD779DRAFT_97380 [Infundibulicybe gibba]|nr:hypothetical protein BD779DRAFT_97380 [Infundibulicybe gibba]
MSCGICIENFKSPMSLPCGHVFCSECLLRAVESIKPYTTLHACPVCRTPYTVANIDPALAPSYLRPNLTPSIRRLFLDEPSPSNHLPTSLEVAAKEIARLTAENQALRKNCGMWRRRAEVHSAATLGLLGLARITRDQVLEMKVEKDKVEIQYHSLKRKFEESRSNCEPPRSGDTPSIGPKSPPHVPSSPADRPSPQIRTSSDSLIIRERSLDRTDAPLKRLRSAAPDNDTDPHFLDHTFNFT